MPPNQPPEPDTRPESNFKTRPGIPWFAGSQVVRTARMNEDGSWTITTRGFGNNYRVGADWANQRFGPGIFKEMDEELLETIMRDRRDYR